LHSEISLTSDWEELFNIEFTNFIKIIVMENQINRDGIREPRLRFEDYLANCYKNLKSGLPFFLLKQLPKTATSAANFLRIRSFYGFAHSANFLGYFVFS